MKINVIKSQRKKYQKPIKLFKGENGSPGEPGSHGQSGPMGSCGPKGIPGSQGPPGQDGINGQKGRSGSKGHSGEPGIALQGAKGQKGKVGLLGLDGIPGPLGQKVEMKNVVSFKICNVEQKYPGRHWKPRSTRMSRNNWRLWEQGL